MTSILLLEFFNKSPQNARDWSEKKQQLSVFVGFFSKLMTESVRNGVLLALNDAFGNK